MVYLFGGWLDSLISWQKRSLAASFTFMFVMMLFAVRAFRPGALSMIPNLIPVMAVAAYCGFFWEHTDSDTFTPMIMALGIGVDDTIHFLVRFRIERERGYTVEEAIRRTFEFSGRAILMTTAILALGFLPFATSAYFTTWMVGVLIPLALVMALAADLLLVPAMCQLRWIRFRGPDA
jgi:predicted RND superfamily exporter protein